VELPSDLEALVHPSGVGRGPSAPVGPAQVDAHPHRGTERHGAKGQEVARGRDEGSHRLGHDGQRRDRREQHGHLAPLVPQRPHGQEPEGREGGQ